jgi:uncharacterized protein (DUF934 family)
MPVYTNATGTFAADRWIAIADDAAVPDSGYAIVSLKRWRTERVTLSGLGVPLGVRIEAGEALEPETDGYERLSLIALAFPKFSDGRSYSKARLLRERLSFKGELRATGEVLLDQVPLMQRAGFDTLDITHAPTLEAIQRGHIPGIARTYQATGTSSARRRV